MFYYWETSTPGNTTIWEISHDFIVGIFSEEGEEEGKREGEGGGEEESL